jgi:hypothetical protein
VCVCVCVCVCRLNQKCCKLYYPSLWLFCFSQTLYGNSQLALPVFVKPTITFSETIGNRIEIELGTFSFCVVILFLSRGNLISTRSQAVSRQVDGRFECCDPNAEMCEQC